MMIYKAEINVHGLMELCALAKREGLKMQILVRVDEDDSVVTHVEVASKLNTGGTYSVVARKPEGMP